MLIRSLTIVALIWLFPVDKGGLIPPAAAGDFAIGQVVFTTGCTFGYREYALRPNNIFKMSASMNLYIEPLNCKLYRSGPSYKAKLKASAVIESLTKPGTAQSIELGELKFVVPENDTQLYADLALNGVGDLPIDLYKIILTLEDTKTQKKTSFLKKFRVGHSYIKAELSIQKKSNAGNGKAAIVIIKCDTPVIYCNYRVRSIFSTSVLKLVLIAEVVTGINDSTVLDTLTTNIDKRRKGSVEFKPEAGKWKIGNYRIEIYINDVYEHALQFRTE